MATPLHKLLIGAAALAALALGATTVAQGQSSASPASEHATGPDRDQVQSGSQTTPDRLPTPAAATARNPNRAARRVHHGSRHVGRHLTVRAKSSQVVGGVDAAQTESDGAGEQPGAESPEQPGTESASGADGPAGHADEPGNANADHQFQGSE